jgi:hypothetical protein
MQHINLALILAATILYALVAVSSTRASSPMSEIQSGKVCITQQPGNGYARRNWLINPGVLYVCVPTSIRQLLMWITSRLTVGILPSFTLVLFNHCVTPAIVVRLLRKWGYPPLLKMFWWVPRSGRGTCRAKESLIETVKNGA